MQFSPLVPQNPPLGVMPMYAQNYELTLKLREKRFSLSGDSFDITDPQGRLYFKMEGSVFNIRDKKSKSRALVVLRDLTHVCSVEASRRATNFQHPEQTIIYPPSVPRIQC